MKKAGSEPERNLSEYENKYFELGYKYIAGVDECGRGCLAGPVAAAAVILPRACVIEGIDDSKRLSKKRRETLFTEILEKALAVRFATVDAEVIDRINILQASLQAMGTAVGELPLPTEVVLIDGGFSPVFSENILSETIIKGDQKSVSVAAASIVAKVTRDRLMRLYDEDYPVYGFVRNMGYGTKEHYKAIAAHGVCPIHRRSFRLY